MAADDDVIRTAVAGGAALLAATGARKALARSWTARRGAVPGSPEANDTNWAEAVLWAVVSGVVVGVVRLVAQRGAEAAFARMGRVPEAGTATTA